MATAKAIAACTWMESPDFRYLWGYPLSYMILTHSPLFIVMMKSMSVIQPHPDSFLMRLISIHMLYNSTERKKRNYLTPISGECVISFRVGIFLITVFDPLSLPVCFCNIDHIAFCCVHVCIEGEIMLLPVGIIYHMNKIGIDAFLSR